MGFFSNNLWKYERKVHEAAMKIIANKFHMKVNLIYAAFVTICMAGTLLIFSGNEGFRER